MHTYAHKGYLWFEKKAVPLHRISKVRMNILKTILLGGAAYYALKNGAGSSDMQKQLDKLSEENDALRVQLIDKEQELKDERNKAAGELQGQLNAFLYVRA